MIWVKFFQQLDSRSHFTTIHLLAYIYFVFPFQTKRCYAKKLFLSNVFFVHFSQNKPLRTSRGPVWETYKIKKVYYSKA